MDCNCNNVKYKFYLLSRITMNYNIFGDKAPMAPMLGKGTECIKLLCSQASNDMISPLIPMFFPALGAHLRNSEFLYPDQTWKETCGMMAIWWLKVAKTRAQFVVNTTAV